MTLVKVLQRPEESIRRPEALNDSVLLGLTNNVLRKALAETSGTTLVDTLNALISQMRQVLYGTAAGNWSDVPATNLVDLLANQTIHEAFLAPVTMFLNVLHIEGSGSLHLEDSIAAFIKAGAGSLETIMLGAIAVNGNGQFEISGDSQVRVI